MNEREAKELCFKLMRADSEDEVIKILQDAGFWDNRIVWRFYGDYENNYNTIGNQQSRPDAALVEKLVNSVDARLMNICMENGFDPEGPEAPQNIREAVAQFFEDSRDRSNTYGGRIREWSDTRRTEVARGITLATTGFKPPRNPCFTISDNGEGQTPDQMPDTLLSLNRSNKLRIPFVQGKFNMGGTGVLKFCGQRNLQLILSRRNPRLPKKSSSNPSDTQWSFTIVRRENPEGNRRSSVYTYLAPAQSDIYPNKGGVLRFQTEKMPIFPDGREPYARESEWGTLIKLYEYAVPNKSDILRKDGMLSRVDLLLPDVALPVRMHECRDYGGHPGSAETTLTGLRVRLEDGKGDNLEQGFPSSALITVKGQDMTITIYAFKKDRADTYRKNEGIIFVVNGQTHGYITRDFFNRNKVGLTYLDDSILLIVDCTKVSGRAREDLFMNSRDRLSGGELRIDIEHSLEELLHNHEGLRELKERRRREEIASKLDDSKPLEDILESLLKKSPTLSSLFLQGGRISTPFKTLKVVSQEKVYEGKRFPTYFKFKDKQYGCELHRECHINSRCRIIFETDADNDFFSRDIERGESSLFMINNGVRVPVENKLFPLQNGIATLIMDLPEGVTVGDTRQFVSIVTDPSRITPFENIFTLRVREELKSKPGKKPTSVRPPGTKQGDDRDKPAGIKIPKITDVFEADFERLKFNKYTGLKIKNAGVGSEDAENGNGADVYDFYVNMDNMYLKSELKAANRDLELTRARFRYGMVLIGLALIQKDVLDERKSQDQEEEDEESSNENNIERKVELITEAVAPVLLPMIDQLGHLELEENMTMSGSGEAS